MVTHMGAVEFGAYLRQMRRVFDVKQADLALRLGKSQAAVSDIERGDRADISSEEVVAVLSALVEGRKELEAKLGELVQEGMRQAGLLYTGALLQELESIPDDEELQRRIVAYEGPNPILSAAAATARGMRDALDKAKPLEEGEVLVAKGRGPRKKWEQ